MGVHDDDVVCVLDGVQELVVDTDDVPVLVLLVDDEADGVDDAEAVSGGVRDIVGVSNDVAVDVNVLAAVVEVVGVALLDNDCGVVEAVAVEVVEAVLDH